MRGRSKCPPVFSLPGVLIWGANPVPPRVPYLLSGIPCRVCPGFGIPCRVPRIRYPVSRVPHPVSRAACPASGIPCRVSRIRNPVSRVPCRVSRTRFPVSRSAYPVSRIPVSRPPGYAIFAVKPIPHPPRTNPCVSILVGKTGRPLWLTRCFNLHVRKGERRGGGIAELGGCGSPA